MREHIPEERQTTLQEVDESMLLTTHYRRGLLRKPWTQDDTFLREVNGRELSRETGMGSGV